MSKSELIPRHVVDLRVKVMRGEKVMLDEDLAELYGVESRALIQAVKRNLERFPEDFMFRLSPKEMASLRSQSVISNASDSCRYSSGRVRAFANQG